MTRYNARCYPRYGVQAALENGLIVEVIMRDAIIFETDELHFQFWKERTKQLLAWPKERWNQHEWNMYGFELVAIGQGKATRLIPKLLRRKKDDS